MTTWAAERVRWGGAFTLLEILLALVIAGLLAATTIPFLLDVGDSVRGVEDDVRAAARELRVVALDTGTAQRVLLRTNGLAPVTGGGGVELPAGWKLQVRRAGEERFRNPRRNELWGFNSEGICEPISLRLAGEGEEAIVVFDPLTALEPPR